MEGAESLDAHQVLMERRYLGLRTDTGVEAGLVPVENRALWVRDGWATEEEDRVRLTVEGWLRLDALVASLD
jgi:hypothetical protein